MPQAQCASLAALASRRSMHQPAAGRSCTVGTAAQLPTPAVPIRAEATAATPSRAISSLRAESLHAERSHGALFMDSAKQPEMLQCLKANASDLSPPAGMPLPARRHHAGRRKPSEPARRRNRQRSRLSRARPAPPAPRPQRRRQHPPPNKQLQSGPHAGLISFALHGRATGRRGSAAMPAKKRSETVGACRSAVAQSAAVRLRQGRRLHRPTAAAAAAPIGAMPTFGLGKHWQSCKFAVPM